MKVKLLEISVVALVIVSASLVSAAMHGGEHGRPWEGWMGSGEWGRGSKYQRMYDPAHVETIHGTITAIERIVPMEGMSGGIHLLVKTDGGTLPVHLGPVWYIERLDIKLAKGDKVEVRGSRVTMAGKPTIVASEVKRGDTVLMLRDENGVPVWSGWRGSK
ncbi:MAG: DNA-binding protein [Alphaproteobacteria bacterium]|uniref:DNA-binding protein n=1 Tax=Candidatus Nitrobium versatile TaxID=2884831 RepID=A0A953M1Q4_9BACT|nr:DNA-binding protein [Candidatus Nitrobium versatile]